MSKYGSSVILWYISSKGSNSSSSSSSGIVKFVFVSLSAFVEFDSLSNSLFCFDFLVINVLLIDFITFFFFLRYLDFLTRFLLEDSLNLSLLLRESLFNSKLSSLFSTSSSLVVLNLKILKH